MKKLFAICCFIICVIISCGESEYQFQLEEDKFISVLKDIHTAETLISRFKKSDQDSVRNLYRNEIAQIYSIDTTTLLTEISALKNHPEIAYRIYSKVYDELNELYKDNQ